MSVENGVITSPVSVFDVRKVLGVASTDVGTLCTSKKINMWSRYKPVRVPNKIELDRTTLWYKGTNSRCGLRIPQSTSRKDIVSYYNSNTSEWTYEQPQGGMLSPYRLGDFLKYYHSALPAIAGWSCPSEVKQDGTFTCSVLKNNEGNDESEYLNAGSLNLREIYVGAKPLAEFYFGCVVTDTSYNVKFFAAGRKMSDGTYSYGFPNFSTNTLTLGSTYFVYPFLAQNPQDQSGNMVANNFCTLPLVKRTNIKVVSEEEYSKIDILFQATGMLDESSGDMGAITVTFKVTNKGTSSKSFSGSITIRYTDSSDSDSLSGGEQRETIPDFTVTAGGTSRPFLHVFSIGPAYRDESYKAILLLRESGTINIYDRTQYVLKPLP